MAATAPALLLVCDLRFSLLEEGRLLPLPPQPPVRAADQAPKPSNPWWVQAIRASGNMACLTCLVFVFAVMVPRSKNKDYRLVVNCLVSVVLSLGFPAMAYSMTMDVDDQPHAGM